MDRFSEVILTRHMYRTVDAEWSGRGCAPRREWQRGGNEGWGVAVVAVGSAS